MGAVHKASSTTAPQRGDYGIIWMYGGGKVIITASNIS